MAFMELHFRSDVLRMRVTASVILPEEAKKRADGDPPYKTLFLLHGFSDDHTIWMTRTSIERYAADRGIAVVMPSALHSWYTDTAAGPRYLTFVGEELPAYCRAFFRGMSPRREDTMVAGLSMGGYGALKIALTYPERFGLCASLSGALDMAALTDYRLAHENPPPHENAEWQAVFGYDVFTGADLRGGPNDLFALTERRAAEGVPFPGLFLWCGTGDRFVTDSRNYRDLLTRLGVAHTYRESEGDHSWKWWDLHIQDALDCLDFHK